MISQSFKISARRIKSELSDDESFYWFYIGVHLEPVRNSSVSLSDVRFVEYHFLHPSFHKMPDARVRDESGGFEYKMWAYGFFRVSADVVLKDGTVGRLPAAQLSWHVEKSEVTLNGKSELSWG